MKYTNEIEISLPRAKVVELFNNPENMPKWQEGLISFETVSGEPGQEGARAKLKYKMGKREIEMVETITKNNLPDEFNGTYEAKNVFNIIRNTFIDQGKTTKWVAENEFRFDGFMKLMGLFMPGAFKKQSFKSKKRERL